MCIFAERWFIEKVYYKTIVLVYANLKETN